MNISTITMSDIAIKAENVGKLYRLGQIGTGTISHDLNRWWAKMRGKEDPFAIIGETNDRTTKGQSNYVWSLKNIDFEIKKGEAVGIVGRNGAGKSTLLKLLSKVTKPSSGEIKLNGRIASLLEVGTGFHPEMTGKENIYLNGAILGMTKKEISRKFDEIVDFSGVERYIDTPVKRYSSGMYVRLAFAVAAHLESEILIVDEVLAVGDAEFQKKCLGKMNDVSRGEGRTVLFVSHNLAAVNSLCNTGILLENGVLKYNGVIKNVIDAYVISGQKKENYYLSPDQNLSNEILSIKVKDQNGNLATNFCFDQDIYIDINFKIEREFVKISEIGMKVTDQKERAVFTTIKPISFFSDGINNIYKAIVKIPFGNLVPNAYKVSVAIHVPMVNVLSSKVDVVSFVIEETGTDFHLYKGGDYGCVFINCEWK